jgi:riboflavin kinase/FMN adenylyltransferase
MSQSSSSVRTPYGKGVLIFGDGAPGPSDPTAVRPFAEPSMESAAEWLRDGAAVTIGAYDGVHLGHRAVIAKLTSTAQRRGLASVVVTFEPHPAQVRPSWRRDACATSKPARTAATPGSMRS